MGFSDESSSGVPLGVILTPSGTITTDTAGDVVSNFDITGGEAITTPTVTPENCRVKATSRGGIVVQALGAVIENCADPNGGTRGVPFDDPATGGVVRGRDTHEAEDHDVEDGVFISITDIVMEDNYIYDLKSTGFDPHHNSRWRHERRPT